MLLDLQVLVKGTLYLYFKSKEQLYLDVILNGYSKLIDTLREHLDNSELNPEEQLRGIINDFCYSLNGKHFITELLRGTVVNCPDTDEWRQKREEMCGIIEAVLRRGVEQGVFDDPHPELTAVFIPGLIRSSLLFGPKELDIEVQFEHIQNFVMNSLRKIN